MPKQSFGRITACAIAILLVIASAFLVYWRNGVLPWLGLLLGAGLLLKFWLRPSKSDLTLSLAASIVWALLWPAIFYYVIYTWETGEVVELKIDTPAGTHVARTWLLEEPGARLLYYDAPAHAAQALLSNAPVSASVGARSLPFEPYTAVAVDGLPETEINRVFGLMTEQYGDRVAAADIFYGFLGRSRDKIAVLLKIPNGNVEPGGDDA